MTVPGHPDAGSPESTQSAQRCRAGSAKAGLEPRLELAHPCLSSTLLGPGETTAFL